MTEPRDNSIPKAVENVITQLKHDNTEGALKQIQDEMRKPGAQADSNKQFLTELTKQCQEQGFLPKLAVDFGKKNFANLDLDNNGYLSPKELQHVLSDKKMSSTLDPFQKEMASYLLANSKEISELGSRPSRSQIQGIDKGRLDTYANQADTKYEAYQSGQKVLKQFGTQEKFDAIDSNKDGFITPAEIDKQIDFADRALALPGMLKPEAAQALKEQKEALEFLKAHRSEIGNASDASYWDDATLKDIKGYAAKNPNPRTLEHIPKIDEKIVGESATPKGRVDMSQGENSSDVMNTFFVDHKKELDLDGNSSVSKSELNKILDTPQWKNTLSDDELRVVEKMRIKFDDISSKSSKEITANSIGDYARSEQKARTEETKSAAAAKYASENFGTLDADKNGWLSQEELDKTKDFYSRALALGMLSEASKQKATADLAAIKYLEDNKDSISSAWRGNDMKQADIEKYAREKAGHIRDIFRPIDNGPKDTAKSQSNDAAVTPKKSETAATVEKPEKPNPVVAKPSADKPDPSECKDGVCPIPTKPSYPHLEAGAPKPEPPEDGPKLEKPLLDPNELTEKNPQQEAEEQRVRTNADLPREPKVEGEIDKTEKEKPADTRFKYTQENYGEALRTAAEQNKPVVLVLASGKDKETVQAAADASAEGKAIVVYVDKDKTDPKSLLGAYAATNLEKHNREQGTNDESMLTVFYVNKGTDNKLQTESAKFANYGNPRDIGPLLQKQIDATITQRTEALKPVPDVYRPAQPEQTYTPQNACNNSVQNYQQYYYNQNQGRRGLFRRR